jgi:hypothetical protein
MPIFWFASLLALTSLQPAAGPPHDRPCPHPGPPRPGSDAAYARYVGTTLSYRRIAFSGQAIRCDHPRFQIAAPRFDLIGGLRIVTRDPAAYSIIWFDGTLSSGRLANGSDIVVYPSLFHSDPVGELRVAASAQQAGQEIRQPGGPAAGATHPGIGGYRYVASSQLMGDLYLGLWRRARGRPETLLVRFTPQGASPEIVGRLPLRLKAVYVVPADYHGYVYGITLISEAAIGAPLYILYYRWMPVVPTRPGNPG